jgi:putative restriction endonuclease
MSIQLFSDLPVRLAAFEWLNKQREIYGNVLDYKLLLQGFIYNGQKVALVNQQGIFKPRLCNYPLTVLTSWRDPYSDTFDDSDFLHYKYRGTNPEHPDNRGLRELMHQKLPLIYLYGESRGKYIPIYPVYIQHDSPKNLTFLMQADSLQNILEDRVADSQKDPMKSYVTREIRTRVHQQVFRDRVIAAYREQCALCRIRHIQLLDAAHIIPDHDERGEPTVSNGLSLCKIHHAAYDSNLMSISPDYKIHVKIDLLEEIDGPMLQHGIKELHKQTIILPRSKVHHPSKNNLAIRFEEFLKAG